jgi:hypothetical protein
MIQKYHPPNRAQFFVNLRLRDIRNMFWWHCGQKHNIFFPFLFYELVFALFLLDENRWISLSERKLTLIWKGWREYDEPKRIRTSRLFGNSTCSLIHHQGLDWHATKKIARKMQNSEFQGRWRHRWDQSRVFGIIAPWNEWKEIRIFKFHFARPQC